MCLYREKILFRLSADAHASTAPPQLHGVVAVAARVQMVQPARLLKAPRKRFRRRASDPRCCAEVADACPPNGPCCTPVPVLRQGAAAACALLGTRETCGRGYVEAGEPASEYCVWLGGRCTLGASADCREAYDPDGSSYYGDVQGFETQCAAAAACPGFAAAFKRYAAAHALATEGAAPPEGIEHARLLVVSDHWRNVGMGFMPAHVASTLVLAMSANIYVYFDNYGRYDWARYFYGHHGLDLRWTPARRRMWAGRFAPLGVTKS